MQRVRVDSGSDLPVGYSLEQWFPTGVLRHPGVPFTIPRGAAG